MLVDILIGVGAAACVGIMIRQLVKRHQKGCGCSGCNGCTSKGECSGCQESKSRKTE